MKIKAFLGILAVLVIVLVLGSAYVVDETEQVVVTRFGKVVGQPETEPGLKFKVPFLDRTNYFPKNLMHWGGDPGQIPTLEKTYIWVEPFARWKITDPVLFFQTVNNVSIALARLTDIIDPAVRNFITSHRLIETVRTTNRALDTFEIVMDQTQEEMPAPRYKINVGRRQITNGIREQAQPKLKNFGIELVDVKIKRINYVEEVRKSVYGRMVAERKQIAEKFRSEGKGEAAKIIGRKEKELKRIESEAYREAQQIKGKADAEATAIYAEAYSLDPEFYSFVKTLQTYTEAFDEKNSVVFSTESEFLKYLKDYAGSP